jgi:hypothetical protein
MPNHWMRIIKEKEEGGDPHSTIKNIEGGKRLAKKIN